MQSAAGLDMSCPFHPPQALKWQDAAVQLRAERIPLKSGLDHLSLALTLDGPLPVTFEMGAPTLMLGFVTAGWAKLQLKDANVEKLESGQWFQMSAQHLSLDRTSSKGVTLEIFLCSEAFTATLSALEP
jgi:hypothetical protein